jgi:hypothetical protein
MSDVFQNIHPPPLSPPGECVPPAFGAGGGHTRWAERGVGGQYFGRRQEQLLLYVCKYFVSLLIPKDRSKGLEAKSVEVFCICFY